MANGNGSKGRGGLRRAFTGCFSRSPRADANRRAEVKVAKVIEETATKLCREPRHLSGGFVLPAADATTIDAVAKVCGASKAEVERVLRASRKFAVLGSTVFVW